MSFQLKKEQKEVWLLTIFSFMATLLVGIWAGEVKYRAFIGRWIFFSMLMFVTIIRVIYLIQVKYDWRKILQIKTSWFSREIILWILFFVFVSIYLFIYPHLYVGTTALIAGFWCLYALDKDCETQYLKGKLSIQSSATVLTSLLYFSFATGKYTFAYIILIVKIALFSYRFFDLKYFQNRNYIVWGILRLFFLLFGFFVEWQAIIPAILLFVVILGELIDRALYYNDFYYTTRRFLGK